MPETSRHCPYYDVKKAVCSAGGGPSNILVDCRKNGKEERICVYKKRLSLLPEQKIDELIDGLCRNVLPAVKEVNEALNRTMDREKRKEAET